MKEIASESQKGGVRKFLGNLAGRIFGPVDGKPIPEDAAKRFAESLERLSREGKGFRP